MNILLTGSSGLIGTALVDRLRTEHHAVTRLVRGPPTDRSPTVDVHWAPDQGAIDLTGLERAGHFDGVVHLAGAGIGDKRWTADRREVIMRSRTESTRLLVDALSRLSNRPPVLVSASAVGFYGDRGSEELVETSAAGTGFLAEVCQAWEQAARTSEERGIRTVFLRTGIVISSRGGALGKQLPLFRLGLGGPMGGGRQYRSWIALEDQTGVILHCLTDEGMHGAVNATAPHPVTDRELAKSLAAALHRPAVLPVPAVALRLALGTRMAAELLLASQRAVPAVLESRGYRFIHPHIDEAIRHALAPAR